MEKMADHRMTATRLGQVCICSGQVRSAIQQDERINMSNAFHSGWVIANTCTYRIRINQDHGTTEAPRRSSSIPREYRYKYCAALTQHDGACVSELTGSINTYSTHNVPPDLWMYSWELEKSITIDTLNLQPSLIYCQTIFYQNQNEILAVRFQI